MNNPFVPLDRADTVIIDGRASKNIMNALEKLGLRIIPTIKSIDVDESISYHPDIVLHPIDHKNIVVAPNVFDYYEDKLEGLGIKLIKGEKYLSCKYPMDIAYNVGRVSGSAIHNFKYTDEVLKFHLKRAGLELINVNQGYSKCSMAIVGKDSIITSDVYIYKRLHSLGFKVLLIKPGYIKLPKQEYGFIGGATGNLGSNIILLSGVLKNHPDSEKILKFIYENNGTVIYLSEDDIIDLGTIICLRTNLC